MAKAKQEINLLEDIQKGISASYMGNFSKIDNVDIDSVPGVVMAKYQLSSNLNNFDTCLEGIVINGWGDTVILLKDDGTNTIDNLFTGQAIKFTTTGTLPAEVNTTTVYYVSKINFGSDSIAITTTIQDAIDETNLISVSSAGTGTHTLVPQYMSQIKHYINSDYGEYALDDDQQVWYNNSYGWSLIVGNGSGAGYGMNVWKGYLFVMRASTIDVYGPLSAVGDTATWTTSWENITTNTGHPSIVGQDDILYIGCDTNLASITEDTTFDPSDTDTYTLNTSALDVPKEILFLEELGGTLMVTSEKIIYPWDTISPSFDYPVFSNEKIRAIKVYNNLLYFIDYDNVIWVTNGSSVAKQGKLSQSDYSDKLVITDKIGINDSKLYFGAYSQTETESSGVYSFNPATGVFNKEYSSQSGETANVRVDCYDNGVFTFYEPDLETKYEASIQKISDSIGRYNTVFFETGLIQIGTKRNKTTLKEYEIVLAEELSTGLGIELKYRLNLTDSWTSIGTMTYTNDSAIYSKIIDNSGVEADQIQFRVEITSRGTGFDTTPKSKAIYVR